MFRPFPAGLLSAKPPASGGYVYECTLTAATFYGSYYGYFAGSAGSISNEPVPGYTLRYLYNDSTGDDIIEFTTNVSSVLGSLSLYVDHVLIGSLSGITTSKDIVGVPFVNGVTYHIGFK